MSNTSSVSNTSMARSMPNSTSRLTALPDTAVRLSNVSINYRRYIRKTLTLKAAFLSLFKGTHYEAFCALQAVDLGIKRGESVGIVGPNGAGKSTLLKAIAGVLPPSSGNIHINGRVAPLLELGAGFKAELTGRENIYLNGVILGLTRAQINARLDAIIAFADIGDFIDAPVQTYSSGMRARLGFAIASDVDADILLLDEILSVGDTAFQQRAAARMENLFKSNCTVILVTHALGQINKLCNRAIYLKGGQIMADGEPGEVIARYQQDETSVAEASKTTSSNQQAASS